MKKRWMVGAIVFIVAALLALMPKEWVRATTSDFQLEGTTLVKYTGTASTVSVPANVEKIGRSAFENNTKIKKITIPDNVTTIEEYAFWGCSNLETVVLGEGLWEVADFTFTACEKLKRVTIPDTIRRIGIMTFADCVSLKDIAIPVTVTDIHSTAFDGIEYLNIHAEKNSYPYLYALERGQNPTNAPMPTLEPEPTEIPPAPTLQPTPEPTDRPIGAVIGSTTIVGNEAVMFVDNREMTASNGADIDREQLLPEVTQTEVAEWSYYGNKAMTSIDLPEGVTVIGDFAFARSGLKKIEIPEGVTTIEYAAFYHCDELEEVVIPNSVTHIDAKVFAFTPWITNFYEGKTGGDDDFLIVGDGILLAYRGDAEEVTIPEGVKYIAPEAFLYH